MLKLQNLFNFRHPLKISVLIYIIVVIIIWYAKPRFLFDEEGNFKQFGVGKHKKTMFPVWLFLALLGIVIYFIIANLSARESRNYYCKKMIGSSEEYKKIILTKCES